MLLPLALLAALAGGDPAPRVDDFACLDQHGTFHKLSRHGDARFVVLYVFMDDCPIVRLGAAELRALMGEFAPRGVRFLGLDPAPQDGRASIAAEAAELGLELPILVDDTQCVAEMLGVTRTAEALVIESDGLRLRWRGPLDDRLEYGGQRAEASRRFLREALEALLAGREPPTDAPGAKGCALTFVEPRAKHAPDYARDVAPILERRCVPCHRPGGIGPWAMDGHRRVHGFSAMMRSVLLERRMTPWHADPAYGEFRGDLWLRPEETRALVHWVEHGAPRGAGEDPLTREAEPLPEWPLGPPDLIVEMPEQSIPATGLIPYRKKTVELELDGDRWVRAVDLRPSNARVLHHGFAFIRGEQELQILRDHYERLAPGGKQKMLRWLEELGGTLEDPPQEAIDYFAPMAFQGIYAYFAKYVPGEGLEEMPPGTGRLLPARAKIAFQMHYTAYGVEATDRPRLGIYFHEEPPPRELKTTAATNFQFLLPAGARDFRVEAERRFDHAFTLHGVAPHMHYRGRSMRYTALLPDGTRRVLMSLPEYSFDWQTTYTFVEPLSFPAGTVILCDGSFDNSRWNEHNPDPTADVKFGPRTENEMFVGYLVYTSE
ncbi:MAG TPA: redoxin domain-containing protein [Planctomycetota bacterium]